ncbi:MAG TPA: peroxiredoxin [Candidatus Acidoferrales bacterium]|nr:peroxiredoxin [Candidatus Acidoferrales bacterium]
MVSVGAKAPEFNLKGIYKGRVGEYRLGAYRGKWLVLFFYPADFTFICPTEVIGFSKLAPEFRAENAEVLGVSVDSLDSHRDWVEELGGVDYPLLSDTEKTVSRAYGVLDENEGVAQRATFIINPEANVSYVVVSAMNVGRSVEETLRVLRALRTERLCPSDWKPGADTGDLNLKY